MVSRISAVYILSCFLESAKTEHVFSNDAVLPRVLSACWAHMSIAGSCHWRLVLDTRATGMLLRAHAASNPPAALSAALLVDTPMPHDDFFRHLFSDADDMRGVQAAICLRLELLPVMLQRTVVAVIAMHAPRLSGCALRFCLERARAHLKDKVRK